MKTENNATGYETQRDSKEKHRGFIMRSLKKEPLLFSELLDLGKEDANGIKSPMGLSRILDEMQGVGYINQDPTKKDSRGIARKAYALSDKGKKKAEELWYISYNIDEMKRVNADHTRHERIANFFGIDADVIFNRVDQIYKETINQNLDSIGKHFVSLFIDKIKSGQIQISDVRKWQKGIVAIEFDAWEIAYALKCGLRLIEDLRKNKDIFKDKAFYLGGRPYSLFALDSVIRWAEVYNEKEFDNYISKIFDSYKNNSKKLMEEFGLDLSLTKQVSKAIFDEKDPLAVLKEKLALSVKKENQKISKELGSDFNIGDPKSLLDRHIIASQLLNYKNKQIVERLRTYQKTLFRGDKHMGHTTIINLQEVKH